jgi:sugar lactone lactonase YvrE
MNLITRRREISADPQRAFTHLLSTRWRRPPFSTALLLLLAFHAPLTAQIYQVTTLAGDAAYRSPDGTGVGARFQSPTGIAVDRNGNVFVADSGNNTIRKITPAGIVTTVAGQAGYFSADGSGSNGSIDGPGAAARFNNPRGLAIDANGILFVADTENHTVRKITPDGTVTTYAGTAGKYGSIDGVGSAARLSYPWAIAVDDRSNVFFTEADAATVRKITPDGRVTTVAGLAYVFGSVDALGSAARFERTFGLAVDRSGNLYVADGTSGGSQRFRFNHTIRKITPDGLVTTLAGLAGSPGSADGTGSLARFSQPFGLAVDVTGTLVVADSSNRTLRRITPTGVVTTLAGTTGVGGSTDGPSTHAQFSMPIGVAFGPDGTVFVADGGSNNTIRKITSTGFVTTLAGLPNSLPPQSIDGTGRSAQFTAPGRVAVDPAGNIYVADRRLIRKVSPAGVVTTLVTTEPFTTITALALDRDGNLFVCGDGRILRITPQGIGSLVAVSDSLGYVSGLAFDAIGNIFVADSGGRTIRRVTPAGIVTTLAGRTGEFGSNDGVGSAALFRLPTDVAVDRDGNVFVADQGDFTIRKVTPAGVVTTFAGLTGASGSEDGTGAAARFESPGGLAFDSAGNLFVADRTTIRRITPAGEVVTIIGSRGNPGSADGTGSAVRLAASSIAVGAGDSLYIAEYTNATLRQAVPLANPARLINFSILGTLADSTDTMTVGTIVAGTGTSGAKPVLVRAAGPSLAAFGVVRPLADPKLEFYRGSTQIAENDNWAGNANLSATAAQVGAFAYTGPASADAALYLPALAPGNNSMRISGSGNAGGTVLAELYDATPAPARTPTTPRVVNVSVLKNIGSGLTAGFVVGGVGTTTVLIRAVGPSLAAFGLTNLLADPTFDLFDAQSRRIATNDNWSGTPELLRASAQVGAFHLTSAASKDAALLMPLSPGNYTVQIRSADSSSTGTALIEIYEVP